MQIVQTYLDHSLLMFNNLPKQNDPIQFQSGDGKLRFFETLPQEFTRKEATEIGTNIQAISPYRGRCADIRHRSISYQNLGRAVPKNLKIV